MVRADREILDKDASIEDIYMTFKRGEADILIGTQMIAKGWDIPNVTLVGVVLADIGLNVPDFRSSERIFQLLTQVAGRTARGTLHGEVIIQTYNPENPAITAAAGENFDRFYTQEISTRKTYGFPPFTKLFTCYFEGKSLQEAIKKAEDIALKFKEADTTLVKKHPSLTPSIIHLSPAIIAYRNSLHHYTTVIKTTHLDLLLSQFEAGELRQWKLDILKIAAKKVS